MFSNDILLTGIPRAGTTLAAAYLDAQPNSVCLNEPDWQHPHASLDASGFAQAIKEDFAAVRKKILMREPVMDRRAPDGSALTNYYESGTKNAFEMVPLVRRDLTPLFTLGMKHNGPYLAVLPELVALDHFEIRAIIRHPLPVLRSWRRLSLPVSRGEMPNATPYWPEMRELTQSSIPLLEKQARMLELMFARLLDNANHLTLQRHEDMATGNASQASDAATAEDNEILAALTQHAPRAMAFYGE